VCTDVNKKRPVNLDIGTISLPLTAYASILHRVSGVFVFVGVAVLLWLLDASLASEESFANVKAISSSFFCKLMVWAVAAGLIYHTVAGVKHLIMDFGYGESMQGGTNLAKAVFGVSIVLIVLVGAWIW
jgi:succinate dehydrogenase / fumarate reductase cytochrome b subunit